MANHRMEIDFLDLDCFDELEKVIIHKIMSIESVEGSASNDYETIIEYDDMEYKVVAEYNLGYNSYEIDANGNYYILLLGFYNITIECEEDPDLDSEFVLNVERKLNMEIKSEEITYRA